MVEDLIVSIRFDSLNKIGESVNSLEVGSDGGGSLDVRVKYENKK